MSSKLKDITGTRPANRMEQIQGIADYCGKALFKALDEATRCCLNCEHFIDEPQLCGLNDKMPPPKIAARGCELFEDKIPF